MEKFKVTQSAAPHQDQYAVINQDASVCFSGYFGHHGPHKFAQGPVLYEALEKMLEEFNEQMPGIVNDEMMVIMKARAALKLARGEV